MGDAMPPGRPLGGLKVAPCALGTLVVLLIFLFDRRFGSFLGDEGYLWYGVQRVLIGEVPVRDFMSYEIGRYYLSAGVLGLFHDHGILALRASLALWAVLGLSLAVSLVAKAWNERRWPWLLMPAVLIGIWMAPRHKIFDIVISIVLVAVVARVIARPCTRRWFWLGIATGAAALIGQNHGAYALVISALVFLVLLVDCRRDVNWIRDPAAWAAGVVIGYLPVICFALFVPGYAVASIGALKFILIEYKGTNLPIPTPWPWHFSLATFQLQPFAVSLFFLALPACVALGVAWIARRAVQGSVRRHPIFVAAVLVAIPYMNVAFSRADAGHLAQALMPALLMALTWPGVALGNGWRARLLWPSVLALFCIAGAAQIHPRVQYHYGADWQNITIGGDRLKVEADTANFLASVQHARETYGLVHGSVLSVPLTPGLSAALGEKSPLWEIYPLFPRNQSFQKGEIARLMAHPPALVIVSSVQLDGRSDLAYSATHPDIYRYILAHYQPVSVAGARPDLQFYIARDGQTLPTGAGSL
ncbi:hypothetical protein [Dyella japonica]|uniref:Glycosyltransferase RgtA/B/C/D-like domain-containing protein n=1 Tax=Dyella japonica DSM 16301 TaxID=1440762 RepID=A0A0G9H4S6_9GAMM|nr:hypothetical protein [Dyella japonica]KLD62692.1 hypothetical protein Y882_14605 [Dyella japonica DSM 16301]